MSEQNRRLLSSTAIRTIAATSLVLGGAAALSGCEHMPSWAGGPEAAANPCNPCNPCAAANPCNPCNPCAAANPCNPCNPCSPCNPCAVAN